MSKIQRVIPVVGIVLQTHCVGAVPRVGGV